MCGIQIPKIVRFLIAGVTAAASNIVVLYVLVGYVHVYYLTASVISFITSVAVGFTLQKFWAFKDTNTENAHVQLAKYTLITTANLCINTLLMYVLVSIFGIWYLSAQILSGAVIAVVSYTCNSLFVFNQSRDDSPQS